MKKVSIVLLVLFAGGFTALFTWLFMGDLSESVSRYSTFANAKKSGEEVDIVGTWVDRDKVKSDPNSFEFYLEDSTHTKSKVHYFDPKPNNFESAQKIVIHGRYKEDVFIAEKIYMKCPSKYGTKNIEG